MTPSVLLDTALRRRLLVGLVVGLPLLAACSPVYVARAGWAQAQILASRTPATEVMTDPATDPEVAGKLRLVHDARAFAIEELGFRNAGDSYTSVATLPSDTLLLLVSAAHRDRLEFRTWWFPIVGRVPYRGYFSDAAAFRARDRLEEEGFDTYLRPVGAFSTLGWFADPIYSTMLRYGAVALVETVLHELAHNHLFIPGQGRFNESWANFAGARGSIAFFCGRDGGGPDTVLCLRAQARWHDMLLVSRYLDGLEAEVRALYARDELTLDEVLVERERVFDEGQRRFLEEVRPELRATGYDFLASEPLNNATLLARTLYYHRLPDFERRFQEEGGELPAFLEYIRREAPRLADPFDLLPD